jgi:hypothetical protein
MDEDWYDEGAIFEEDEDLPILDEERDFEGEFEPDVPKYVIGSYGQEQAYATSGPTDVVEGISKTAQRIVRSGKEEAVRKSREILNGRVYDDLSAKIRDRVIAKLQTIENISLFNLEILVLACIFVVDTSFSSFQKFKKKYKNQITLNEDIDILRYIRFLKLETKK